MGLPDDNLLYGFAPKLTDEQREYVDSIFDNQLTIVNAKAGTGKTTLAVASAAVIGKPLIYTFNPVEERTLGFTPGTTEAKESKYITPLIDALSEIGEDPRIALYREDNPDFMNKNTWVRAMSHVYMRGINIKDSTLIIDEAQNMTRGDLKKVLTRVHNTTKVIMIGHTGQNDLTGSTVSGFEPYLEHFRNEPYAKVVELTHNFRGRLATKADELTW